jgi:hypothetical protein
VSTQKKVYIKEYTHESEIIVAVCDKDLVGKRFGEDDIFLNVTESFYKGQEATEGEVIHALKHATVANLVGKRAIKYALEHNFIEECNVIFVSGVPHAQMVKI